MMMISLVHFRLNHGYLCRPPRLSHQVFHTYDYRYQDGYSRQRVAAMYLPLIHHMAAKV